MRSITNTPVISSLLFCCAIGASCVVSAQTDGSAAPVPATIISPVDASAPKGRMASADQTGAKEAKSQAPTAAAATATATTKARPIKPQKQVTVKKPLPPSSKRQTGSPRVNVQQAPLTSRGDQFSYRHRGLLKALAEGDNRFGGQTFALPVDIVALEHADALAGFMSFDNLGTLRERKIYRANGSAEVSNYDPRSGNITQTKTEVVNKTDALTAGGLSVMPGTNFEALLAGAGTAKSEAKKTAATPDTEDADEADEADSYDEDVNTDDDLGEDSSEDEL